MKRKLQSKEILFLGLLFISIVAICLLISWKSLPNQEGYFEAAWQLSHINFAKAILSPEVTPLNFLTGMALEKSLGISLAFAWKIMDVFFAGLIGVFLTSVFWKKQQPMTLVERILPALVIISSVGFMYSFTSMSGEGIPVFFALVGLYLWQKRLFFHACLFFVVSFLAKYTIYLIAPGIVLWTLFNMRSFSKKEWISLFWGAVLFISIFVLYHSVKQWVDIKLQVAHLGGFSISGLSQNFPPYFLAIVLGAPLIAIFALLFPSFQNLFWLAGVSSLLMLLRRYFYWNHPQQILVFWMLYFFTSEKSTVFLKVRPVILQIVFSICLLMLLPVHAGVAHLFYRHMTQSESLAVDNEIQKDYHGGKVGYYLNRRFDEPFPTYEISYMEPTWDFVVKDTEYVVIPKSLGFPQQLINYSQCAYTFHRQLGETMIYKVKCSD